jgi:hypothetical protein
LSKITPGDSGRQGMKVLELASTTRFHRANLETDWKMSHERAGKL